ncbi:TonB-dependent receptor domain-containing protein [Idiomarina xiamenensis]|uniref:TonB-dependent receptor n=1 Tax=Idiomarina xiamenensis 10-D-4 TaxID=740709 RepID=K2K670_9GAMM|nr:TonB-dependent receptor [Idiomarina xiamenensis]EKE82092.1 TonB-dependent receptor [Idiomarina xiamenensis 10-D-4]
MKKSILARSISNSVLAGLGASMMFAAPAAFAQDSGADGVEKIQVTGSRIKRADLETSSPVSVFDAEDIVNTGVTSVAEFLRYTTASGPGGNTESATLSQVAGSGSVDGKGFGSAYTLVLLNGRRLPVNAIASDFVDLNQIPMAAVERIEYLADGASAIYGSDAIAGVINIITKKDMQGVDFNVQYGTNMSEHDGDEISAQIVAGATSGDTSILFAFDYWERKPVKATDRDLGSTAWLRGYPNGDGRSPYGLPGWYEVTVDNDNDGQYTGAGEFYSEFADADCPTDNIIDDSSPTDPDATYCAYDFAELYQLQPASDRQSIYTTINHRLSNDVTAYGEFRYSRAYTKTSNAPAPGFLDVSGSPFADDFLQENLSAADYAAYQAGVEAGTASFGMGRRYIDFPNRQKDNINETFSSIVGFNGFVGNYDWDFHVGHTKLTNRQIGAAGQLLSDGVVNAIASGDINPFVFNNFDTAEGQAVLESLQAAVHRTGESVQSFAGVTFGGLTDVMLPGGALGFAVGADWRREAFEDRSDPASVDGQVIGGAGSNGKGNRNNLAYYAELSAPLFEGFELKGAVRRDDIAWTGNDAAKTTYQLGATWRINQDYMLRASYGTGFKAPDLHDLFLGQSFGVTAAIDYTYCEANGIAAEDCPQRQLNSRSGGNAELQPEESKNWNVGIVASPFENFDITVDYWSLEVENMVGSLTIQEIINNEDQYPELVNRINGRLFGVGDDAYVLTNLQNLNEESAKGISLDMNYLTLLGGAGEIRWGLRAETQLEHLRQSSSIQPLCDDIGTTSEPDWKANFSADWKLADHSAGVYVRYVGETQDFPGGRVSGSCDFQQDPIDVDSYTQVDAYYGYQLTNAQSIKVGIRNLFDEDPPISTLASGGWPFYDQSLYNNSGRFIYARYNIKF